MEQTRPWHQRVFEKHQQQRAISLFTFQKMTERWFQETPFFHQKDPIFEKMETYPEMPKDWDPICDMFLEDDFLDYWEASLWRLQALLIEQVVFSKKREQIQALLKAHAKKTAQYFLKTWNLKNPFSNQELLLLLTKTPFANHMEHTNLSNRPCFFLIKRITNICCDLRWTHCAHQQIFIPLKEKTANLLCTLHQRWAQHFLKTLEPHIQFQSTEDACGFTWKLVN